MSYEWKSISRSISMPADGAVSHMWDVKMARWQDEADMGPRGVLFVAHDGIRHIDFERDYPRTRAHFRNCAVCWEDEAERLTKENIERVLMRVMER